ncbi:RRXRR domain-containing protein [Nostoc sp. FACHB-152]|uniref:RRXRR domain-containing protein n=1 Tax=unclassified Nostoc TaxID=2593658 RepID=UPI001685B559|nr:MULTISPECIES: RRXRR domain-containing protein [unclassified Nostoc]MBD2450410.1 RRXRR domain-containing protein [Nostoc sp. FACHB-152]MBD2471631.1 RRXRR domain-containing protein [Nostoc sp. FACHB-145]
MTKVLILDVNQQPLCPVRISHARLLLSRGKAAVFQRYPFTIILKESVSQIKSEPLGLKLQLSAVAVKNKKAIADN